MSTIEFNQMLMSNVDFLKPFAVTLTRDSESAKDLFQETLYRALANRDKYSVGTNIKAWLYTIMRNVFINNYRRKSKQGVLLDHTPDEFLINQNTGATSNGALGTITMREIQRALKALPEIFRGPFVMYYEGFKYYEISEILGEPLGTIKSRIHFARKMLKMQLQRN